MAIVPARGEWKRQMFDVLSTATFVQGSLVKLGTARTVSEYSGGEAGFLGVSLHSSTNSLPAGKVLVQIPIPGATAFFDVPTGISASSLSMGESFGVFKSGNTCSYLTIYASTASRVVQIVGVCNSANSTIECAFLQGAQELLSSTASLAIA